MKCSFCLTKKAEYIEEGSSICKDCLEKEKRKYDSFFKRFFGKGGPR